MEWTSSDLKSGRGKVLMFMYFSLNENEKIIGYTPRLSSFAGENLDKCFFF